ncbi:protein-tyrosine-phosphatase [Deinococcus malanensis]|uniref:Protein-tyrosine-phosphatase n=1 Tax=Deinococcus malanensis TaxID=1706855 RepID=A0ABQ2EMD8_9DEIO|nr:ABC transporter ATP-binding protein [Deinococcus malanensis]GGK17098.1 protein-tyrosine-phosphatase [Deinococcus malanensis]
MGSGPTGQLRQALPSLLRITRRFWPYIRKERGLAGGALGAMLLGVFIRLLEPWPLKVLVDSVLIRPPQPVTVPGFGTLSTSAVIAAVAVSVVIIVGLRALTAYASTVGFAVVANRVLTAIRTDLYAHLQRLSLSFHSTARSGELTSRVIGDVGMLRDVVVTAALPMLGSVLILVGMIAVLFVMRWELALLALVPLPILLIRSSQLSNRIREVSRKQRKREGAMASTVTETMSAIKVVQALSLEAAFLRAFGQQNSKNLKESAKSARLSAGLERSVDVLIAVSTALVMWFGARLVLRQELSPGDLLVFLTYLKNAFKPVQDFAKYTGRLAKASAAGERILEVLDRVPDVRDLPDAVPAPVFRGHVRFENVHFGYDRKRPFLRGLHLEIQPGQQVAVVGMSGAGKSTILALLLRLYDPTSGRVTIDGHDLPEYTLESLRSQISVVLQENLLFAASLHDNIAYARPDATRQEVREAAQLANADEFIMALPDGYDTVVGERGQTLSGGQRQRIAVARAALRRTPLLILDEPTNGLDRENEQLVMQALSELTRGRTSIFVTHNLQHASQADLIVYLEEGRVLERGSHSELLALGGRYAALYRSQSEAIAWEDESHAVPR